jgi:uncharacterized YigZ family protein
MTESFFTISQPTTGLFKDKGSKFLAFAHPVTDSEQIKSILETLRKEYFDARHHCYAWVLGADKTQSKAFDDGEPNHSAGDPIHGQIRSKNLTNVLVVVVRYFGGVKLGVGGLITAYKTAAAEALNQATIIEQFVVHRYIAEFDYPETSLVMSLIKEFDLALIKQDFKERCRITFDIRLKYKTSFIEKIKTLRAQGQPNGLSLTLEEF